MTQGEEVDGVVIVRDVAPVIPLCQMRPTYESKETYTGLPERLVLPPHKKPET